MFIKLNHQALDVYNAVRELTKEIYRISVKLPAEEKFNMVSQIRRAGLSIKLNLAEVHRGVLLARERDFLKFREGP